MKHARDEVTQNMAELLCWDVAGRDDARIARRLYRKQLIGEVYRLDAGVLSHDIFYCLEAIGVMALLEQVHAATIHGARVVAMPIRDRPIVHHGAVAAGGRFRRTRAWGLANAKPGSRTPGSEGTANLSTLWHPS